MQKVQKVGFINKIDYLVKVEKILESSIFSSFEKWRAKSSKGKIAPLVPVLCHNYFLLLMV
jgi:hypothetical protein